jgi:hypothetical protein
VIAEPLDAAASMVVRATTRAAKYLLILIGGRPPLVGNRLSLPGEAKAGTNVEGEVRL